MGDKKEPIFRPKKGPIFMFSRWCHFILAAGLTAYPGHLWGYGWAVVFGMGSILLGFGWEVANRYMKGPHPYGDALDFWAFVAGACTSGVLFCILK